MKFDDRGLEGGGGIDLAGVGIEKEARHNLGLGEFFDDGTKSLNLVCGVEAALGRDFGSVFGDEADFGGLESEGEVDHSRGGRHFEVGLFAAFAAEPENVLVLNVTPVLPKMDGDGVGSGGQADAGEGNGIRLRGDPGDRIAVAGLPKGGKVVNIHAQADHGEKIPPIRV